MAENLASRASLPLDISISDGIPALSLDVEQAIYRIAQEAVTNVISHANAKRVMLRLDSGGGKLKLVVRDDGVGFDVERAARSTQFGLTGMKERAEIVGGGLAITSLPGSGTAVELTI